ncbi:MAG: LysR family transcriptional regulator [Lautropia sp.]|nr:LysR family transcriptional regulator [Lautropia sp.]
MSTSPPPSASGLPSRALLDDLRPMLVFAAVLEHGSMHAAARTLGMTASAVSQHVSRLEGLHGVRLLHRSTRRLTPTDAGRALEASCRRLKQSLADTLATLLSLKEEAVGELRMAIASGLVDAPAFQQALRRLREEYPGIRPILQVGDTLTDLQQGAIDIALRGGEHALDDPDLIARHLTSWPWQICAAPAYLAGHAPITHPSQLTQHPWLHARPIRMSLHRGQDSHLLQIDDSLACDQLSAVRALTLGGFGLSLQLAGDIRQLVADGRLQVLLPDWTLPSVNIYAVTSHRVQSARTRVTLALLQHCFADAPAQAFGR